MNNSKYVSNVQGNVKNYTDFEFSFLKMENNKKNMIYSPTSIEYAINLVKEGAVGSTYDEINKVIGNVTLPKYTYIDGVLSFGNGLFIRNSYSEYLKSNFTKTLKEKYYAEVVKDDFKNIQSANQWMEGKTLGIIKNMLNDDTFKNPDLLMLIINALSINMEWSNIFYNSYTNGYIFFMENGKEEEVTMMFRREVKNKSLAYYEDDNKTVLTMDFQEYNGIQFEFMAIMPYESLSAYVKNVSKEKIREIDKKLKLSLNAKDGVNVKIPKFKFNYNLNLKKDLNMLGIKKVFSKKDANFSKMAYVEDMDRNLFVSEALHKSDINFNEDGIITSALKASTKDAPTNPIINSAPKPAPMPAPKKVSPKSGTKKASKVKTKSPPKRKNPVNIIINQPFMFVIRDKNTKDIWFTGTVYEPNLWENDKPKKSTSLPRPAPISQRKTAKPIAAPKQANPVTAKPKAAPKQAKLAQKQSKPALISQRKTAKPKVAQKQAKPTQK